MDERNSITKYKQKKKRKSFLLKLLIILLVLLGIVLVVLNRETLFSPFKDAGLDVGEGGFPVTLPGSTEYHLGELAESFYLLTDTYIYTYNEDGAEIAGIQHGFQNPVSVSSGKRALVYDKNGNSFKMYSRTGEIYKNTVTDSIVFAQIGNTERTAIVTTSTRYSNYLYVYNSEGNQIFRWASPDEKIMGMCFGEGDTDIYVSVVGEKNGELKVSLIKFNLKNSVSEVWKTELGGNLTYSLECCKDGLYAVTGSGAFLVDTESGEIKASNTFTQRIYGIPDADDFKAMIFHDSSSNGKVVVAYNSKLEPVGSVSLESLTAFDVYNGRLYILEKNMLSVYNSSLNSIKTYELNDEYSNVRIIDNFAYLLGYNTVECVEQ